MSRFAVSRFVFCICICIRVCTSESKFLARGQEDTCALFLSTFSFIAQPFLDPCLPVSPYPVPHTNSPSLPCLLSPIFLVPCPMFLVPASPPSHDGYGQQRANTGEHPCGHFLLGPRSLPAAPWRDSQTPFLSHTKK